MFFYDYLTRGLYNLCLLILRWIRGFRRRFEANGVSRVSVCPSCLDIRAGVKLTGYIRLVTNAGAFRIAGDIHLNCHVTRYVVIFYRP